MHIGSDDRTPHIPFLSFFTGAGFLDLGFSEAGFEPVWHNESNPEFIRVFEFAMGRMGAAPGASRIQESRPIQELDAVSILSSAFPESVPEVWGVIGGPPCPDFSVGGKNAGASGERGILTRIFVELILELGPTFFVIENVPGLIRTEKHRAFLEDMIGLLETNYVVAVGVLNALDFGVPQDRRRLFIVGLDRRAAEEILGRAIAIGDREWFPWPYDSRYAEAKTRFAWPRHGSPSPTDRAPAGIPPELMVYSHIADLERECSVPNSGDVFKPRSARIAQVVEGDDSKKSFKRLHRWRYSPTVAYGNNEVHLHPTLPRRLSVREALRLQGVPDSYQLPADTALSHKFKMVGNGVPVGLAAAVAEALSTLLRAGSAGEHQ